MLHSGAYTEPQTEPAGHMTKWIKWWFENHLVVPGSIPPIGKITKNTDYSLTLVPNHG